MLGLKEGEVRTEAGCPKQQIQRRFILYPEGRGEPLTDSQKCEALS